MMTPQSNRPHVSIFGETNAGKSALFNAILGQSRAIVSPISGTTTDPVSKAMELLPFGPIVLTDTAGINDRSELGAERAAQTKRTLERTDLALYAVDASAFDTAVYDNMKHEFEKRSIPHFLVLTKSDIQDGTRMASLAASHTDACVVSIQQAASIDALKQKIAGALSQLESQSNRLIGGLLPGGSLVAMVVPVDSQAPKGRLILPQVQLIRDCLDHDIRCHVSSEAQLHACLAHEKSDLRLVVTDSQIFPSVSKCMPADIPLTSFSILMARQKGGVKQLYQSTTSIQSLCDGDKVIIAEACTHTRGHEDIGRVKIPQLLSKTTGKAFDFHFLSGYDFSVLEDAALVIHCGGCMITSKEMGNRIRMAGEKNIPITNYGMVLAYCGGILERSVEILRMAGEL